MCQKKPGPRCAHHLGAAIASAKAQIDANREAFTTGQEPLYRGAEGKLAQLQDEFDETRTGQAALAAEINALENADAIPFEIDMMRTRMLNAADRREAKVAALKSLESENPRAAKFQLRYGAHAAWLADSDLPNESKETGGPVVYRDYAAAITYSDSHDEQVGYEEQAVDVEVTDTVAVYEAPVTHGPRRGTWVVGADEARRNHAYEGRTGMRSYEYSDANQSFRTVQPVLFDETTGTVARYDVSTGQTLGAPVPVSESTALSTFDYNDGLRLTPPDDEDDTNPNAAISGFASKVEVRPTGSGTHILRGAFEFSVIR